MRDKMKGSLVCSFESMFLIIVIVAVWYIAAETGSVSRILLPSPLTIGSTFMKKFGDGSLLTEIGISVGRVLNFVDGHWGILKGLSHIFRRIFCGFAECD